MKENELLTEQECFPSMAIGRGVNVLSLIDTLIFLQYRHKTILNGTRNKTARLN